MGLLLAENIFNLNFDINDRGRQIVIRDTTNIAGPTPYPNPPQATPSSLQTAALSGDTEVAIAGDQINGRLIAGDEFTLGSDPTIYTVTAPNNAQNNAFTAVSITPSLVAGYAEGVAVNFIWSADTLLMALMTSYPARLVNGTTIQTQDQKVRFMASAVPFRPTTTMKMIVVGTGDTYSLIAVHDVEVQGAVYAWSCQARR
jgi:hypothetical protein